MKDNNYNSTLHPRNPGQAGGGDGFSTYYFIFKYHKNPLSPSGGKQTSKKVKKNYTQKKLKVPKKQGKTNTMKKYKVGKQSKQSKQSK
jgi:hypothetical protein